MLLTLDELREHRDALEAFERDYRRYVDAQKRQDAGYQVDPHELSRARGDLLRRAPRAQRALDAPGSTFAITPPPLIGGHPLTELSQQAFAHETPLFSPYSDPFAAADMVLDRLVAGLGALDDKIDAARRPSGLAPSARPHRPTLWGHLPKLPAWLGTVADVATLATLAVGGLKAVGVF
jgi:hypothetical protein